MHVYQSVRFSLVLGVSLVLPNAFAQSQQSTEPGAAIDRAWSMLSHASEPGRDAAERTQAMAALGSMGDDPHAARLISETMRTGDQDVRVAAILAAGQTKNHALISSLQQALDDERPQVAFSAAVTLWKMGDTSGEDLLLAVVTGERSDKLGLIAKEKHKADKALHSPGVLTEQAINGVSGAFLGPFGFGVKAIELARKNGGDPGRAQAVDAIAEQHSEHVRLVLTDALSDKDTAVRAAAARALGRWPGSDTARVLLPLFDDDKQAVRLSSAAGYIRALNPHPSPEDAAPVRMENPLR